MVLGSAAQRTKLIELHWVVEEFQGEVKTLCETRDNRQEIEDLHNAVSMLNRALANQGGGGVPKPRIPEPRAYSRARDANEIDNFLFDMEIYFTTA